ncbi:MAG: hypothetical protein ACYTAF_14965, partial [Planctomycetota bacterium]
PEELKKVLDFLLSNYADDNKLRGKDVWGPIFRLQFLAKIYTKDAFKEKKGAIEKRAQETIAEMRTKARSDGGWAYYDFVKTGITFVGAVGIMSMIDAKEAGLPRDQGMLEKACSMVLSQKQAAGQYRYRPGVPEAAVGCAGRSSLCELALLRAGKDQGGIKTAIDALFKYRHLLHALKGVSGTHVGEGKTAPYYYHFGHYFTTRAIKIMPKEDRALYQKKMSKIILKDQGKRGEFFDWTMAASAELYATSFGVLTFYELARKDKKPEKETQ